LCLLSPLVGALPTFRPARLATIGLPRIGLACIRLPNIRLPRIRLNRVRAAPWLLGPLPAWLALIVVAPAVGAIKAHFVA
jgi:hypothetical protein